jgi:hypothetical protein
MWRVGVNEQTGGGIEMTSQEIRQQIETLSALVPALDELANQLAIGALDGGEPLNYSRIADLLAERSMAQLQLVELQRRRELANYAETERIRTERWGVKHDSDK